LWTITVLLTITLLLIIINFYQNIWITEPSAAGLYFYGEISLALFTILTILLISVISKLRKLYDY